jgi:hypothetical protein
VSLFYGIIGNVVSVGLAVFAFLEAELKGRIVIFTVMSVSFIGPRLWPGRTVSSVCFLGRIFFAIGLAVYLKVRAVPSAFS